MTPFPWDEAMSFGFGVLRLSPQAFWAMTPRELAQAVRARRMAQSVATRRPVLDALMARFPDRSCKDNIHG